MSERQVLSCVRLALRSMRAAMALLKYATEEIEAEIDPPVRAWTYRPTRHALTGVSGESEGGR